MWDRLAPGACNSNLKAVTNRRRTELEGPAASYSTSIKDGSLGPTVSGRARGTCKQPPWATIAQLRTKQSCGLRLACFSLISGLFRLIDGAGAVALSASLSIMNGAAFSSLCHCLHRTIIAHHQHSPLRRRRLCLQNVCAFWLLGHRSGPEHRAHRGTPGPGSASFAPAPAPAGFLGLPEARDKENPKALATWAPLSTDPPLSGAASLLPFCLPLSRLTAAKYVIPSFEPLAVVSGKEEEDLARMLLRIVTSTRLA